LLRCVDDVERTWQRWFSENNAQYNVATTGILDATTQELLDASPAAGWVPSACSGGGGGSIQTSAARAATLQNLLTQPSGDVQGQLALVIVTPLAVTSTLLAVLIVMVLCAGFAGPRLPMASKRRAHEDAAWLPAHVSRGEASISVTLCCYCWCCC
jgi:hypothetical protein